MKQFLSIILISLAACNSSGDATPKPKSGVDLSKLINNEVLVKHIEVAGKSHSIDGKHAYNELELKITDAAVKTYSSKKLESLSSRLSNIMEENISNLSNYEMLTITFVTSDGSRVSDSAFKYVYKFEVK